MQLTWDEVINNLLYIHGYAIVWEPGIDYAGQINGIQITGDEVEFRFLFCAQLDEKNHIWRGVRNAVSSHVASKSRINLMEHPNSEGKISPEFPIGPLFISDWSVKKYLSFTMILYPYGYILPEAYSHLMLKQEEIVWGEQDIELITDEAAA